MYKQMNAHNFKNNAHMEFDSVNRNGIQSNNNNNNIHYNELLKIIQEQNSNNKFGFYDIYLEFDTKYRDRSNVNTFNSEFKFKISGRKDISAGIKTGVIGLNEPVHNLVQLEVGDFIMPNILKNKSTVNRIYMVINELLGNEVTTKSTANLSINTDKHFIFDVMPVYNMPLIDNTASEDITIDVKYIRLVPVIKSLLFKTPTTETLDELTISFYINNEKIIFPADEYKCTLQLGPNLKNEIVFPENHGLHLNDIFEINEIDKMDDYILSLKNNSKFLVYNTDNNISTLLPNNISNQNLLKLYDPLNNNELISFLPSYTTYKNLLSKQFNADYIKNDTTINFLIDGNYHLIKELPNNTSHKYLTQSIMLSINDSNTYNLHYQNYIYENEDILKKINNNNNLINQTQNEINASLEHLFTLKSFLDDHNIQYNVEILNNNIIINGLQNNKINLYIGNKYIFNQTNSSNLNVNGALNIITNDTVFITKNINKNDVKLSINDIIQDDYNFVQNGTYNINLNHDTMFNAALVLMPSDSINIIQRLNSNNILTNTIINYIPEYISNFVYPITYYIHNYKILNTELYNFNYNDFTASNLYYLRQYGSHNKYTGAGPNPTLLTTTDNKNNDFYIKIPNVSFNDTIYEMPFQKYRGYNFDYNVTAKININTNNPTTEKRDALVDISISPYNIYYDYTSPLKSIVYLINGLNNPLIDNTQNYLSFDGTPIYNDTLTYDEYSINNIINKELRPLPYKSENPYLALKWKHIYKFDFSQLIQQNIKYVILELLDSEGAFTTNINTKTFGFYTVEPGSNINTPIIDPSIEDPDISHVTYIIDDNGKNYFKINITVHDILYIDLRELLNKNTTNTNLTPTTYDKKYLFGRTFKLYYENMSGTKFYNNYSILKLGSLLNINSYYMNYTIESYSPTSPECDNTIDHINKFQFKPYSYNMQLYYEPPTKPISTHYYKIFREQISGVIQPVLYVLRNDLKPSIVYSKVNSSNIFIETGDKIILDLNHHSNNNNKFKMKLTINNEISFINCDVFTPPIMPHGSNEYISNYETNLNVYDISDNIYGLVTDIYDTLHETYTIQPFVNISMNLTTPVIVDRILNYNNNNGPIFNLSFGRNYRINFNELITTTGFIKENYNIILKLNNDIYNIFNQPISIDNLNSIIGVTYDLTQPIGNQYTYSEFQYNSSNKYYFIQIELNSLYDQYFQFDLRYELFNIDFDQLNFDIYLYDKIQNIEYDNIVTNINLINYKNTINLTNLQDEFSKSLEYNDIYNPKLQLLYTSLNDGIDSDLNNILKFKKESNRKKMYMSNEDNYNDYMFSGSINNINVEAKNIYKLHISDNLSINTTIWNKLLSTYRLQKMTGNNRDRFNVFDKFFSDIDLFYSYTYYIDFTEYTSYLFNNFLTDYNTILNTNDAVIELYTDSNLNNKYTGSNNLLSETYDPAFDKYNYFSSGLPSPLPIVRYKLIITNDIPNKLYYGISFIENIGTSIEKKITIKGGCINIHNINISLSDSKLIGNSNNADNIIILYKNSDYSDELLKCKSYFMCVDNLFNDDINNYLYQLNEYQNAIELYYETPKLDEYDFYLKRNDNHKDKTYNLSYKSLQNYITAINNSLYKDMKGIVNESIQVISTLIDPADKSAGVTFINSNIKYTKKDIYFIAGNTYYFNLDDKSNAILPGANPSYLGHLILEAANGIIDISNAITINPGSTYILSKNKLKFLGGQSITTLPLINTFSLNVSELMSMTNDYIIYYYENHPNQKGKIYMNGTQNGNITTQAKDQERLIENLKKSNSSNVNLFDVYENQKILENINNNMLKLDGYKYNIELSKLKNLYNDIENQKITNNNMLLKFKNKILTNTEKLSSLKSNVATDVELLYSKNKFVTTYQNLLYELINNNYFFNNSYIVKYDMHLYQNNNTNDGYYIHIDNKYDNRFNNNYKGPTTIPKYYTQNLILYKDNLYIFEFKLNKDILRNNSECKLITDTTSNITTNITYLKLYKKVIDENNVRFIELINNNNDDQYIYINKTENNISVDTLNTISIFIPFNSDISELYYGVTDSHNTINPTFNTLNSSLGKISFEYTDNDLQSLYNANYIIDNNNNSFILQEFNNNVQKYTIVKLDNGIYNKDNLITNITNKLNDSSQYNFKYDVINDNNIDINLKIKLKTDYIKIFVTFLSIAPDGVYAINTIDTNNNNYFNKSLNGNESLYIGNKYLFDYSSLKAQRPTYEFHIYLNDTLTKIYNSSYYFNDVKNNKLYIEITENTPDILYYGFNDVHNNKLYCKEIYMQTYENIINVKYDTGSFLLQFHYTYDNINNINIPFYKQSDLLRIITDQDIPGYHANSNFALKINEYYIFDYSHESIPNNYQFHLYSDQGLTTIYNKNVENDTINRKLKIYITNETTSLGAFLYYAGVNNSIDTIANINGGKVEIAYDHNNGVSDYSAKNGFKIRFDMDDIYDEIYSTNNINFYNSIHSDYSTLQTYNQQLVNTDIIIKRPCQIILSNEFISQKNINIINKETNYIVYLYNLATELHAVIREYNPTTKQYEFNINNNIIDIIVTSTLPAVNIIYLTKLNDSFYDKNDYLNTPQTIYNSKYLISYDDDVCSYYHILNVAINYSSNIPIITTTLLDVDGLGNKIKKNTTNNCRVSNNNINNNYEPISINDTSASNSTDDDHKRFTFAILFDLDKKSGSHIFNYLYYDEINNNIVFAQQNLNINNVLLNLITEPNLLLFENNNINITNVVFDGVSSVIDLNQTKLIYTFRYLSNLNYYSSYIVSINLIRTDYSTINWNIICNEATGVYKYSSINGNSAIISYNTNSFIWTGRNYINNTDTNRPLDTVFKIFESTDNNLVQRYPNPNLFINEIDNEDKTLFKFIDNTDNNTKSSDVIYGNAIPNSTKILLIQCHSNKRSSYEYQSFINVKTIDINTSLVNGYYTIKLINDNIKIDDRNYIIDNVGNHFDVIDNKASNAKYNILYGTPLSINEYQYPIANFKFTDYNIYKFYIFSLFKNDEKNILSYVFVDDVLEYDNRLFTMNKNFLGVSPYKNTPSTYNFSNFWLSDNNILKLSKYNINNTNINFNHYNINAKILDLTKQIDDDFNEHMFYKNQENLIINTQNQIGYDPSIASAYQNLYNDINVIGMSINKLLVTSNTNVDNYIKKQENVTTSDTYDIQIQDAENVYKSLITDLVISTNTLESYKNALNLLLIDIQKSNSVFNTNNIAYYANKYITANSELTLLNALVNEKNAAIDLYNNENINYNLTYYNNLSKISEYQSLNDVKNTIINDGLNAIISNIYNQYKLSGFNNNLIDPIYLQNIVRNDVSVYIPHRRFKIPMTLRVVIKDKITNYLNLHI